MRVDIAADADGGWYRWLMGKRYEDDTEFGGVPGQPFPAEKGYEPQQYEVLRSVYQTDAADPDSGAEIVTQRVK